MTRSDRKLSRCFFLLTVGALTLWGAGHDSHDTAKGCSACKLLLSCDYYVARKHDLSKRNLCEAYAQSVDIDGSRAKAAWYWLLAGKPEKAFDSAKRAIEQGQNFAAAYAAMASAIAGKKAEALEYWKRFRKSVSKRNYVQKEIETLKALYPKVDFSGLK